MGLAGAEVEVGQDEIFVRGQKAKRPRWGPSAYAGVACVRRDYFFFALAGLALGAAFFASFFFMTVSPSLFEMTRTENQR